MNKPIEFIIKSNLLVSIAVAAMVYQTQILFDCLDYYVLSFAFFSTLLIYNFQRIYKNRSRNKNTQLVIWMDKNKGAIYLITTASVFATLYLSFHLNFNSILLLLMPFLVSILYVVRMIRIKKKSYALREIPRLKIFLISFIWSMVIVFLPLINYYDDIDIFNLQSGLYNLEKFFFILAVTIPFDIRDLKYDPPGLKTIAQNFGAKKAAILGSVVILICIPIVFILFKSGLYLNHTLIFLLISYFIFSMVIIQSKKERKEWFYGGLLESFFILQSLGVVLLNLSFN